MKHFLLVLTGVAAFFIGKGQTVCPVIPLPVKAVKESGVFPMSAQTVICAGDASLQPLAVYLRGELQRRYQLPVTVGKKAGATTIYLKQSGKDTNVDAYTLIVNKKAITIAAAHREGIFNGIATLLQLSTAATSHGGVLTIDGWKITDAPQYAWRGLMLDESRFFFGKKKVLQLLDWMAFYKLNRFHWHLTDVPGWRLEIRRYPLLTTVGGIGNIVDSTAPAAYYTQEDIREIVAYAGLRNITVVPEIDMPGHAAAANRAYPAFDGGGTDRYPRFTFNPGREGTYQYLSDILTETAQLFPAGMIHLGGDEVTFGNAGWDSDTGITRLKQQHGLKDRKAVEDYFIQRMADTVLRLHNKVMAWDEIATATLPADSTIVCWWRHDKPEALAMALDKGYSVVLCPRLPFYFDFVQDSSHHIGRRWAKGAFNSLETVYNFSAAELPSVPGHASQVLGVQACIWTETVHNDNRLDFLLFPRISALAETAWTPADRKNFKGFTDRLKTQQQLYKQAGLYYFDIFNPGWHKESGKSADHYID
ncbi:beta-N-acetylhexosaminidase [Chitinophaga sp. Ak27]|uniref:beta-N-acetylhexosaminidase n=1 Tax=Chitinophaga sp. Ak27 TaxID=2726116 RepID=UPI00145EC2BB|nr:beta-N-acetylhexosaminidase [Chitinophaga sp. Ak27]NLU90873.1 beta-N-acetylhexosaminidase [Chitinophaga sp. Ak27]